MLVLKNITKDYVTGDTVVNALKGIDIDIDRFNELMQEQKQKARDAHIKSAAGESWKSDGITFENIDATEFVGYTEDCSSAKVVDIVVDNEHLGISYLCGNIGIYKRFFNCL